MLPAYNVVEFLLGTCCPQSVDIMDCSENKVSKQTSSWFIKWLFSYCNIKNANMHSPIFFGQTQIHFNRWLWKNGGHRPRRLCIRTWRWHLLSGVVSLNAETQRRQQRHQITSSPWHTYTYGKTNYISWCCFCFKMFAPRMKMVVVLHYGIQIYFPTTVCTLNIKYYVFLVFLLPQTNVAIGKCLWVRMCKCTNVHTLVTIGCLHISCI